MSFNWYARRVRDPERDIWQRWSALHSCLCHVAIFRGTFSAQHGAWVDAWQIRRDNPPTPAQLLAALTAIEVKRNQYLERRRAFERRRVREKMRGKWQVTNTEWEKIWRPALNIAWRAEDTD